MNRDAPLRLGPDSPARAETRRDFLIRLAKTTAFVPPLILTHEPLWAQGAKPPPGLSKVKKSTTATITADPTLQATTTTTPTPGVSGTSTYSAPAPWTRPPEP